MQVAIALQLGRRRLVRGRGANGDRRKTMDGEVVNFYVHYEIDGDTSKHVLKLDDYGGNDENSWVLLEVAETDDTNTTG